MPTERLSFTVQPDDKDNIKELKKLYEAKIGGKLTLSQVIRIAITSAKKHEEALV